MKHGSRLQGVSRGQEWCANIFNLPRDPNHVLFTDQMLSNWEWMKFVGPLSFELLLIKHKYTIKNLKRNLENCGKHWHTIEIWVEWLISCLKLLFWLHEHLELIWGSQMLLKNGVWPAAEPIGGHREAPIVGVTLALVYVINKTHLLGAQLPVKQDISSLSLLFTCNL